MSGNFSFSPSVIYLILISLITLVLGCSLKGMEPTKFKINFYISTRKIKNQIATLINKTLDLRGFDFDPKRRTTVIVHGFMGRHDHHSQELSNKLLEWVKWNTFFAFNIRVNNCDLIEKKL